MVALIASALLAGCVTVSVESTPRVTALDKPIVESVQVNGPVFRDLRSTGYETSTSVAASTSNYSSNTGYQATLSGTDTNTVTNQTYEWFDNRHLEQTFVRLLEDTRMARRVNPQDASTPARFRFDAAVYASGDTGAGKIAWNVLNSVLMLTLLPTPFLGNTRVEVEIRAYDRDEYVRSYYGESRTSWTLPGLWGLAHTAGEARQRSISQAGVVALSKAVQQIADHPPSP